MRESLPVPAAPSRWQSLRLLLQLPKVARLCWRLLADDRVGLLPKGLLVGAVVYVVVPFDLIPDFVLPFGEMDDVTVLIAAVHYFLSWCPPHVLDEHAAQVGIPRGRLPNAPTRPAPRRR